MKKDKLVGKAEKLRSDIPVLCEQCGRKIPRERLKAIPETVLCVHCAAEAESEGGVERIIPLGDFYDPGAATDRGRPRNRTGPTLLGRSLP